MEYPKAKAEDLSREASDLSLMMADRRLKSQTAVLWIEIGMERVLWSEQIEVTLSFVCMAL